jgi:hypothetical protein
MAFLFWPGMFLMHRSNRIAALLALVLTFDLGAAWGQSAAAPQSQATTSLADPLHRADTGEIQLHFFYVHGMGINAPNPKTAPQDFQVSQQFRTSFCKQIGCTTKMGEFQGRNYANEAEFGHNSVPPALMYLGQPIWSSSDDWHAAAPFVDHYKLVRNNGTIIYVHEINWWPLVFSAKCRQIVAKEAALVDRDEQHIATCAAATAKDSTQEDRFKSYAWITNEEIQRRVAPWPQPALINRRLRRDILDWGFADALLAVGPMRKYLVEGIRELVLDSVGPGGGQEFVVVSHSLGSYLLFSALDLQSDPQAVTQADWRSRFERVLSQTSNAYFMANQVRLLELASLDAAKNIRVHLDNWGTLRTQAQKAPPQIVAWSDPGDLLTWQVPDLAQPDASDSSTKHVQVVNRPAKNAWRWFGLIESPAAAHTNYDINEAVVREMVPKQNRRDLLSPKSRANLSTSATAP